MDLFYFSGDAISPMALFACTAGFFTICYIAAVIKDFFNK